LSFTELAPRLKASGDVSFNQFLLRLTLPQSADTLSKHHSEQDTKADGDQAAEPFQITLFPDGRAIIKGTDDATVARGIYARYIGN
jgi:adenylyltransferase/sulfurtransferase